MPQVYKGLIFRNDIDISTLLELQSHFGDNTIKFQVVCPQIGTAVLKGLKTPVVQKPV